MSKITNDEKMKCLRSGKHIVLYSCPYPYVNNRRQRVKRLLTNITLPLNTSSTDTTTITTTVVVVVVVVVIPSSPRSS